MQDFAGIVGCVVVLLVSIWMMVRVRRRKFEIYYKGRSFTVDAGKMYDIKLGHLQMERMLCTRYDCQKDGDTTKVNIQLHSTPKIEIQYGNETETK